MPSIELKIIWGRSVEPMLLKNLNKAIKRFAEKVVSDARKILRKQGKNNTGNLSKSLTYSISLEDEKIIQIAFNAPKAPYWEFVNWGVQGFLDTKKAPDSPFRFGSGKTEKGTLRGGINRWVTQKSEFQNQVRDEAGRFITRKSLVYLISRSVWNYGIAPSHFYTDAVSRQWKRTESKLVDALLEDVDEYYSDTIRNTIEFKISI
tara:strand:+ start:419 stop:1033 length:615 start_codon:yes stop_codon:yes gene_type:complete